MKCKDCEWCGFPDCPRNEEQNGIYMDAKRMANMEACGPVKECRQRETEVRNDALEQAARLVENMYRHYNGADIVAEIRALKREGK